MSRFECQKRGLSPGDNLIVFANASVNGAACVLVRDTIEIALTRHSAMVFIYVDTSFECVSRKETFHGI